MTMAQAMDVPDATALRVDKLPSDLRYVQYEHRLEHEYLPAIRALISKDLSEPYSIYVYRYFLCQWGKLCFMVTAPQTHPAHSLRLFHVG